MLKLEFAKDAKRIIAAILLLCSMLAYFYFFPEALSPTTDIISNIVIYSLLFFLFCGLFFLLFNVTEGNQWLRTGLKIALLAVCGFALVCAIEILASNSLAFLITHSFANLLYSEVILMCIAAALFAIVGRMPVAMWITTLLAAIYGYVDYFVLKFKGAPLTPQDILGTGTALDVLPTYTFQFTQSMATALMIFVGVIFVSSRIKFTPSKIILIRCTSAVMSLLFALTFLHPAYINRNDLSPNYWDQRVSATENGNLTNFIANFVDSTIEVPDGYSVDAVNKIASDYSSDSISNAQEKPDVILILGESWADIAPEDLAQTNQEIMPFIKSLGDDGESVYSNLMVSTAYGGTSVSEFQVLTGTNMLYGMHSAPLQTHVTEPIPNMAESFKQLGYGTTALHTGTAESWGRNEAYPVLGFDRFISVEDMDKANEDKLRSYPRDSVMYDEALDILNASEDPQFIYALTIQTHGGYEDNEYQSPIQIEDPSGNFSKAEQYLGLLNESDADLEAFIEALSKRDKPTIVITFGDHLPVVDTAYSEEIKQRWNAQNDDIVSDSLSDSQKLWDYKTFFTVWANYPLPDEITEPEPYMSISYLNPYIFEAAGLPLTGYQKFLLDGYEQYPATTVTGFIDDDGNYLAPAEMARTDMFTEQSYLQYNLMYDRNNYPKDFYRLKE